VGFLAVVVFDAFHTFFFQSLGFYPAGYIDLSTRYWILGRISEAVLICLNISSGIKVKLDKWAGTFVSLVVTLGISLIVLNDPNSMPVLQTQYGITNVKISIEILIVIIYIASLVLIKERISNEGLTKYRYILIGLYFAVAAEICFCMYGSVTSFYYILGHMYKLICYYCYFMGIFASTIVYPYKELESVSNHTRDILHNLRSGIITYNSEHKVTFINQKAQEILNCTESDIIGISIDELIKSYCITFHPKNMQNSTAVHHGFENVISLYISSSNENVKLKYDTYELTSGDHIIIFDRAEEEQALENIRLQTQTILDSVSNPIFIVDKHNKIIMCNKALIDGTGMPVNAVLNTKLCDFLKSIKFEAKGTGSHENVTGKIQNSYEASLVSSKGYKWEVIYHTSPIYNVNGDVIGSISVASDITNVKEQQQKLHQQEKLALIGQIASGIVHEIKNPLSVIKGFSQILASSSENKKVAEYASFIDSAADDINKVVTDFLSFSKPHPAAMKEISINSLLKSVKSMMESYLTVKGVSSIFSFCGNEQNIMADDAKIKEVMLNIIGNAVDAMAGIERPMLRVASIFDEVRCRMLISISDNGRGMSPEQIRKVGTPFFTTKENGTGLGISICYQIINEHGGKIDIESELGMGTTFTISLPCSDSTDLDPSGDLSGKLLNAG
jgi:PAS domain S-box